MTTPPSSQPVLIQPVESPVICKPYYEPTLHYEYDRATGRATKEPGRRPAAYWYKLSDEEVRQQKLPLHFKDARGDEIRLELDEGRRELVLVNKLRSDVKRWRNSNYEGATNVTKDLLRHWSRKDRPRRLFFCQLEAAETVIFLNEIRGTRKIKERGINPPEGCVNPMGFVELAKSSVKLEKKKGLPIALEYVDKSGRSKTMALPI